MDHEAMRGAVTRAIEYVNLRHEVWELLKSHQILDPLQDSTPPDLYCEMKRIAADLELEYSAIERICLDDLESLPWGSAEDLVEDYVKSSRHPDVLQNIMAGYDFAHLIWDLIEPHRIDTMYR